VEPCLSAAVVEELETLAGEKAGLNGRSFTMSHAIQASKRKSRTKSVTALAVAGRRDHAPTKNTAPVITLGAEEISGVRVATFYVFDNENARTHRPRLQFVKERRHRGSAGAVYGGSAAEVTEADPRAPEGPMVCKQIPRG
jgi:hypothetical protein